MQSILESEGILSKMASLLSTVSPAAGSTMATALSDRNKKVGGGSQYLGGSISNYTKNLIMTFPMLCDNSLLPSTAAMISKANERNIITMLQLLFASVQLNGNNGAEILSKLHKNIDTSSSVEDVIDALDDIVENANMSEPDKVQIREAVREMMITLKQPDKSYPVSSLNETSLNNFVVLNGYRGITVHEASDTDTSARRAGESDKDYYERRRHEREETKGKIESEKAKREEEKAKREEREEGRNVVAHNANIISKQLLDTDVKKANELQPALMIVQYNETDDKGNIIAKNTFVSGVKSRMISVDSSDIMERIISKNKTKLNFLNLIRATSGEISFWKDFIFCFKQAKINAKNAAKRGQAARMWQTLEKRSSKNNFNKLAKAGNDASAITTLTVNQETVNMLKKMYNFDLENIRNTKFILEQYNLLGIVICDESAETAKFFYDGNDSYELVPYSFLEREGKDNSYKKVINLLNSTGR